eukprot:TRINITY_DN1123_c0_g1_i2.p1 TRINITY_DN1123_c0_g1~~TRINITY_DN1123_c0_g1_i2.p1  ORF type:complete len:479 (-),score=45.25 TRINITY_DN1123_c0_g1_i2:68-1504(-)
MLEYERRTMKMQLQNMSKRGFILVFSLFFGLFVLAVIVGAVGPHVFEYKSVSSWQCPENTTRFDPNICTGWDLAQNNSYFIAEIRHLDELNQQLQIVVTPQSLLYGVESVKKQVTFILALKGRDSSESKWNTIVHEDAHVRDVSCSESQKQCDNITLVHEPFISYANYQFNISLKDDVGEAFLGDVFFTFVYVHHSFTLFELWFRFAFLLFTFVILLLYFWMLRGYFWNEWSIEQKWVAILLGGLVLYNNPFFPSEILVKGWEPVFLDQIFVATFLFMLLFFWLVMFDGIRLYQPEQRGFWKFYSPKLGYVGVFWILALTLFAWQELHQLDDPEYDSVYDITEFKIVLGLFVVFLVGYLFWLGYLAVRALGDRKTLPYLGVRLKFFGVFTLIVIFFVVVGILIGLIGPVHNNAAEFLSYLALLNLYVYVLAFVYLPTKRSSMEDRGKMIGMIQIEDGEADTSKGYVIQNSSEEEEESD